MKKKLILYLFMAFAMTIMCPATSWAQSTFSGYEPATQITAGNASSYGLTDAYVGYYAITKATDLAWFASAVNNEYDTYKSINAVLTANIDLTSIGNWTAVGSEPQPYTGTFDGNGHSITNMTISNITRFQGLFGNVGSGSKVINFSLSGTMTASADGGVRIGGVSGTAAGANTIIENVTCSVDITIPSGLKKAHVAGIVGGLTDGATVKGCTYTGTINAGASSDCLGGIVGYANIGTIINCSNEGSVTTSSSGNTTYIGGILGYQNNTEFKGASNCLNTGTISAGTGAYRGAIYGFFRGNGKIGANNYYLEDNVNAINGVGAKGSGDPESVCTKVTADQLSSGEICYKLNGSTSTGALAWYQKLGVAGDSYPVLVSAGDNTVYYGYSGHTTTYANTQLSDKPEHNYVDGICTEADAYEPATQITAGNASSYGLTNDYVDYYAITKATDLAWLASAVNNENATYNNIKAVLTADIDLSSICHPADAENGNTESSWTPIGYYNTKFLGVFDGKGHSITGLYINYTRGYQGLFGYIFTNATIKNFSVSGEMKSGTADIQQIGGVVGYAGGADANNLSYIENVTNNVNITVAPGIAQNRVAGIAGEIGSVVITNCVNNGTINAGATPNGKTVGGIAGYATGYGKILYCLNAGEIKSTADSYLGGILGYVNTSNYNGVQYCLNIGTISKNSNNSAIIGYTLTGIGSSANRYHSNYYLSTSANQGFGQSSTTLSATTATSATAAQLSSGEICYKLNGSTSTAPLAWYQKLGTPGDAIPVLKKDGDNNTVYCGYNGNCTLTYANTALDNAPTHNYVDGICTEADAYEPATQITAENASIYGLTDAYAGYYAITRATDLAWLASAVNNENATYKSAKAVLTANIDLSGISNWTPIGNATGPFKGKFDGNNHSITGMTNAYTSGYQGLFGNVTSATLKNFTVSGTMTSSAGGALHVGGVVGLATSSTIQNVVGNVSITIASGVAQTHVAGIAGASDGSKFYSCANIANLDLGATGDCLSGIVAYSNNGTEIKNCINKGNITTTAKDASLGGIIGYNNNKSFKGASYCLNTGILTAGNNTYTGAIYGRLKNSSSSVGTGNYYLAGTTDKSVGADATSKAAAACTEVTADQLSSGEICYLLNGSTFTGTLAWYQTIGTDNIPVLDNTHGTVYPYADIYSNVGNTAKVVFDGTNTLTFYFDTADHSTEGTVYSLNTGGYTPGWYENRALITTVVFDDSFINARPTSGCNWFYGCEKLTTITNIGNLNTSKVTNMTRMFYECSVLKSLDLSGFNTKNVTTMYSMFEGCSKLESLNISSFNTAKVTNMSNMFYGCQYLQSLDVTNFNTDNVTEMSYIFFRLSKVTVLDVSGFNTSKLNSFDGIFSNCSGLKTLDVSNFNTLNATSMDGMFKSCSSLTTLDVSNFNTSKVTSMREMFNGCSSLTTLDLSNFNTSKVTSMKNMFYSCSGLETLDISSFNTEKVTDMNSMFYNCRKLTVLDLSNFNTKNVTDMYQLTYYCLALKSLIIGNFDMQKVTRTTNMFTSGVKTLTLKALPYLMDETFNTQFTGDGATVNYDLQLNDNSCVYSGTNYLPAATTWTAAPTYSRQMANEWGTIVVPFAVEYDADNTDYKLYKLTEVTSDVITFTEYADNAVIPAGTPMAIKAIGTRNASSKYEITLTANTNAVNTAITTPDAVGGIVLTGTYAVNELGADDYIISKNAFWRVSDLKADATYWGTIAAGDRHVYNAPFRAYLHTDGSVQHSQLRIGDYSGTTAVQAIGAMTDGSAEYYDLSGRRLESLQPGVNIIKYSNGKQVKVVVSESNQTIDF